MFARTSRLTLRPGWPEDAPALTHAIAHEAVAFRLARLPWPYTVEHARAWLEMEHGPDDVPLVICAHDRDTGPDGTPELVGGIGLHPSGQDQLGDLEIGYWLTPSAWGRGYATEAGRAMLAIARHALGRRRLVSGHFLDNHASGRVLEKLGFERTGVEKRECLARGEQVDCATFAVVL